MNFYEAQEFFAKLYPGKKISYEFDDKCHRFYELVFTDGVPNPVHHIENRQVKVTVEGMDPLYVPIMPHRECADWDYMKNLINRKQNPTKIDN